MQKSQIVDLHVNKLSLPLIGEMANSSVAGDLGTCTMVEHLPSMHEALGLIPSTVKNVFFFRITVSLRETL